MNDLAHGPTGLPQLRTLLLTDLCDSTTLVERLGDGPAAGLFQAHDRLVLQLQQRWRGRLIDRSDGLLLLFERPIDGLGFALDYVRGLLDLGRPYDVKLQARAGLHVGEVLTWRNSDEAVQVGAKPLEVEGLAKPMAGRLMSLARPGQILLSAVAEPLASRSARELGERGEQLVWKPHGRWCFKGVPGCQEIFEVGEAGIAPLRAPAGTTKAWRDIPLWRRPAALAAELALIAGLGGGLWFATRPQPAIAFGERDWVVVGDLRNLTGDKLLDDSLEQAFRISLEQSRYVNVLSDLKARETLQRMRRGPDTPLDREVASEIALREGARAVLLPTVAEVGGRVKFSVELVDPSTQATVYAEAAESRNVDSVLASVDQVNAELRERLGEEAGAIAQTSRPLPTVTTANLLALRAYALGQEAIVRSEFEQAKALFTRATSLDPNFALAWIGLVRVAYANVDASSALAPLRAAQRLKSRLPDREALYLDAWSAEFERPGEASARWVELARLYPDFGAAQSNAAMWLQSDNRFKDSLTFALAAANPRNADVATDYDTLGRAYLALGRFEEARTSFEAAIRNGYRGSLRRLVLLELARDQPDAARMRERMLPASDRHTYIERTALALAAQRWSEAVKAAETGRAMSRPESFDEREMALLAAVAHWKHGDPGRAAQLLESAGRKALRALASGHDANGPDDAALALASGIAAQRMGRGALLQDALREIESNGLLADVPTVAELLRVANAERERHAGRPDRAIRILLPGMTGPERYMARMALYHAYVAVGDANAAQAQRGWLQRNRGLAYADKACGNCLVVLNVIDAMELDGSTG